MHDPMTVAFEIPNPLSPRYEWATRWSQRSPLVTIWHVDPERRYPGQGSADDSCDWFGSYRPLNPRERAIVEAMWCLQTDVENKPIYGSNLYRVEYESVETGKRTVHGSLGKDWEALSEAIRVWRQRRRSWWQHPRWHVWHWKIQIHPLQNFKRWAFSRCEKCGGRFRWGEAPVSDQWEGTEPLWFRSEKHVRHGGGEASAGR